MAKKFLVNLDLNNNQLVNALLGAGTQIGPSAVVKSAASAPSASGAGSIYFNSTDSKMYYATASGTGSWVALTTGGTSVSTLNTFSGAVTLSGTSNQITVTNSSNTITLSLPTNVTLPGKTTLTASTTGGSSLNIPAATAAPTSPASGDFWTTPTTAANILYYNGSATKTIAFTDSSITGNAATATALATARTINGVSFDGTANITVQVPISTGVTGLGTNVATFLATPSSANLASAMADETGSGTLVFSASPTFTGTVTLPTGATSAAPLKFVSGINTTSVVAGAMEFDGTNLYFSPSTTRKTIAFTDGNITGNAATATALATARTINGVSFDGTANITVAAAAGTLTGTTMASNVVSSSLTSVGTLSSLTVGSTGITLTGATSGTTSVVATGTASGTITIPAATDTLVGKATTDVFTNKTYDTAGTGNVFKINGTTLSAVTGSGSVVLATSPTLITPVLGTVAAGSILTNATGLPISTGVSGLGTGVATFLATPSSANLASALTDKTGTGVNVFANTPTLITPVLGAATATSINGLTISSTTGTLTLANGSTLATSGTNSITLTSTGTTNVTLPTSGTLATQAYVDAATASLDVHDSVKVATTTTLAATYAAGSAGADGGTGVGATITFSATGTTTLDTNVTLAANDRVLVKNGVTADAGTASKANGIYYVSTAGTTGVATVLTRAEDSNNSISGEMNTGDFTFVSSGTSQASTGWVLSTTGTATTPANGIKIGTDNITYTQFSGTGTYTASGGVTLTGINFTLTTVSPSSTTDSSTKNIVSSATVNSTGQVTAQTTTALGTEFTNTSGTINLTAAGIANSKLTNSSVTVGSTSIALGATATTIAGLTSVTSTTFVGALTGNASTATTLATPRAINGTNFDGSAAITITANTTNALTIGTGFKLTSGTTFNGSAAQTLDFATGTTTQTATGVSGGGYNYGPQKQIATITGNSAATSFAVNHNFGSGNLDFIVQVYDMTTGEEVAVDIVKATAAATVTITFATAPASTPTYKVVLVG